MRKFTCGLLGIVFFFFCSCVKEEKVGTTSLNTGKQIFDYTENNMGAFLSFFDISMRMNSYLEMSGKNSLEAAKLYFPEYDICKVGDRCWVGLNGKDTVWRIEVDDLELTTETAVWKVESCLPSCYGTGIVTCTGWGKWLLELKNVRNEDWNSNARLSLYYGGDSIPTHMDMSYFSITGSAESVTAGIREETTPMLLNMEIVEPLHKVYKNDYLFDSGLMYMRMKNMGSNEERSVKADLKSVSCKGRALKITYKGEVYSYNDGMIQF